jgi:ubiquinone/menaquinone biosynthesis C-methylase UbiE
MSDPAPYVLGTGDDELERLGLQHALWRDDATLAWKRAGVGPGARVLDVGAGPGFASLDLAALVGRHGSVLAVDESPGFVDATRERAAALGLPQVRAVVGDAQALERVVELASTDVAWARWLLCFVQDPMAVLRGVHRALVPGGRFVIHDYFNYTSMTLAPRSSAHDRAVAATAKSWRERGGDPDIAGRLPELLHEAGFELTHLALHARLARAGEPMFAWPHTWWHTYAPKLVAMGELAESDCAELCATLERMRVERRGFCFTPPVHELIAVKR